MRNKLRLGFDARMIEHSGIGIRIRHLLEFFPFSESEVELLLFGDKQTLQKYPLPKFAKIIPYTVPIYSPRELIGHPAMKELDRLEVPHFNIPIVYANKCYVTVHDLIPIHFSEAHGNWKKRLYRSLIFRVIQKFCPQVYSVSNFTKQDMVQTLGFRENQITVLPNGYRRPESHKVTGSCKEFLNRYGLPSSYLLAVGIDKPHKNFAFLFSTLAQLWKTANFSIPLVLAGAYREQGILFKEFFREFPGRFFLCPEFAYEELSYLYQGALCFVYPSLWEGFGFPGLEAQANGCPVLASHAGSLPEVLGSGAVFFDPRDARDLEEKIRELTESEALRKTLKEKGLQNAQRFPWELCVRLWKESYFPEKKA